MFPGGFSFIPLFTGMSLLRISFVHRQHTHLYLQSICRVLLVYETFRTMEQLDVKLKATTQLQIWVWKAITQYSINIRINLDCR